MPLNALACPFISEQPRRAPSFRHTSSAAAVLPASRDGDGVSWEKGLCPQRPGCQEHPGHQIQDMQGGRKKKESNLCGVLTQIFVYTQISDFGMSRDLEEGTYYISHGGSIPVKWTAPEVCIPITVSIATCCVSY